MAEFTGRARRRGNADPVAIDIHPLIGQRDNGDDRAGLGPVRIPVELAIGELVRIFIDALGERRIKRECGGCSGCAAELTAIHSLASPTEVWFANRRRRLPLSIMSASRIGSSN